MAKASKMDAGAVLKSAEDWAVEKQTKPYVLAGVMQAAGWAEGRVMSEAVFDGTVATWLNSPVSGGVE